MINEKDKKILDLLSRNCKSTTKEMSEKLGLPITTVHNRIKKMEENGIIKNYMAVIDHKKLGKILQAFIQISVTYSTSEGKHLSQEDLAKKIYQMPEVEECYIMTGTTDILISVRVSSVEELNNFLINKLRVMEGVQNTLTAIVLSDVSYISSKPVTRISL